MNDGSVSLRHWRWSVLLAEFRAGRKRFADASACPGKVGTGFPIRTCAKSTNLERIPIRPDRDALWMRAGV